MCFSDWSLSARRSWLPLLLLFTSYGAAETVTVRLIDGRSVTGSVDSPTDRATLWIRRDESNVELSSGFAWAQVVEGEVKGQVLDQNQFREWAIDNKQPGRKFRELVASQPTDQRQVAPEDVRPVNRRVRAVDVEAILAHWDNDAQSDGLRAFVSPFDERGEIVPVDGQVDFTLVVEIENYNGGLGRHLRPQFHEIERWSQIVRRKDFRDGPAVIELPFSQHHPDFDYRVATQALLHARLGVPGYGVFESSDSHVFLREYSCFRDHLQYYTRGRYLPLESGGGPNR